MEEELPALASWEELLLELAAAMDTNIVLYRHSLALSYFDKVYNVNNIVYLPPDSSSSSSESK